MTAKQSRRPTNFYQVFAKLLEDNSALQKGLADHFEGLAQVLRTGPTQTKPILCDVHNRLVEILDVLVKSEDESRTNWHDAIWGEVERLGLQEPELLAKQKTENESGIVLRTRFRNGRKVKSYVG